jgi:hypothetical protein
MYNPMRLSGKWVIIKNNEIVTNEELGQKNSFNFECEAWEAIEDKPQFTTIITSKDLRRAK